MNYRNIVKNFIPILFVIITPLNDKLYSCEKEVLKLRTSFQLNQDNIEKQDEEYKRLLKLFEKEDYLEFLKDALPYYNKILKIDEEKAYVISTSIADAYDRSSMIKESLKYHKIALSILKSNKMVENQNSINFDIRLAETYSRIGGIYQKLQNIDSAKIFHDKVENLPELNEKILYYKGKTYNNLSGIYQLQENYIKAKEYALRALEIHRKRSDKLSQAISFNHLGNIYAAEDDFPTAKENYYQGIYVLRNDKSLKAIDYQADLYYNLAWAMRTLEEYEAYDSLEKSMILSNEIRQAKSKERLEQFNRKYNYNAYKDQAENKRLKSQRIFVIIVAFTLFIISLLVYFLRGKSLKQKNLELQLQQTELLKNKELDKLKSETQSRILNATIDGKETERKQIAEILHDSVSTLLSSANLHLHATKKRFNGNTPLEILKSQEIIQEATYKIRDLSHNLISSVLLKFGLDFALKDLSEKFSNTEMSILVKTSELRRYNQNFEIKVYNIIQEFINNAIKHSKASNTLIKLSEKNNTLYLVVADDGIGFDKSKIDTKKGLGLNQIDARIQIMDGEFTIKSSAGNGTEIFVKIPIIEKDITNFV